MAEANRQAIVDANNANLLLNLIQSNRNITKVWFISLNADWSNSSEEFAWDNIVVDYQNTRDIYQFYYQWFPVKTITLWYTNNTKTILSSVDKL